MPDSTDVQTVTELPIAQAANEIVHFEKAAIFFCNSDIVLGHSLSRLRTANGFSPARLSTTVRNFRLQDVVLDADTMLLLKDSSVIPETNYFVAKHRYRNIRVYDDRLIRCDDEDDHVIGYNFVHWGYNHWLTQCLPTIDWSLRQRRRDKVRLVLPRMTLWQEDFLALLGYAHVPRLVPTGGAQYLLPHAEYSQFLNGTTSFRICLSAFDTYRRLLDAVPLSASPHPVIYVPCSKHYYGPIVNEAEAADFFRAQGAFIADPDRMTAADRINLFRHAEVVIGPLGETLADIVFCQPGALVWELMPMHHQNSRNAFLAQANEMDYWADAFESVEHNGRLGWRIDLAILADRFEKIAQRLALDASRPRKTLSNASSFQHQLCNPAARQLKPFDEVMLEFESLGDNCEFGLVQRDARVEPLGLLRFASFAVPVGQRLEKLVSALQVEFAGLGARDTFTVELTGDPAYREFIVKDKAHALVYHTGILEGVMEANELRRREATRLTFLRRKLMDDLKSAEKIWVWKSMATTSIEHVKPLLDALRRLGPNILLWVVEADTAHPPGTIECVENDLIKGYVERFSPYDNATDIRPLSWYMVCQRTHDLCCGPSRSDADQVGDFLSEAATHAE